MKEAAIAQTENERLNAKLEQANRQLLQSEKLAAIGQLAAGVAHEINNPVGYIYSNLQSLEGYLNDIFRLTDAVDSARSLEDLQLIKKNIDYDYLRSDLKDLLAESREGIDRVKTIISAMKDFSHIEDEEFKPADLHRGIETTLNVVNNELKYKAEIIRDFGDLPEIDCIISQINQVIMNLLVNAAHAIEEFGKITIRTRHEGEQAIIEIEDNGKGISPENLNRIFEPFYTTKPIGKGTGLGLSLSFNIVEKHKGRIEALSTPGHGTCFRITLPVNQPEQGNDG
ncbi:His Kinase A (phospho-acceptor) domain-containing protein [Marinobacter persicus]|uniref:histidine kinase n=1 Tax=Marinobacter persicus TaxID=930118 RepID=A0A1I3SPK8_9GAMM|nr:ATP-binding protein [Marinobacter persicus]GHD41235.1 histidine kinase [Marinobacter persicus]SFJ60112.1 His Kinase A (phospho-acceptor) domain-containing protein [Marinobacter persicus]